MNTSTPFTPGIRTELLELREEKSLDVLVLTSDRGYIGDFITRTMKVLESFIELNRGKNLNLFIAGRRGAYGRLVRMGAVVFEEVLTKDVEWEVVSRIRELLVDRYRKKLSDACYVIFHRPEVELGEVIEIEEREKREALVEESPFFYPKFEEVLKVKPMYAVERGRYRPIITRFLPPDIRKRYLKETIVNIEAPEEAFVGKLLELYISFFLREVFIEHFTSLNFARYRTLSRILENIDRKLSSYRFLLNKLRQERITKEIEDIVFAFLATEEKRLRHFREKGYILEVDAKTVEEEVLWLKGRLEELGFSVREVRRRKLTGGFILLGEEEAIDLSVDSSLFSLWEHLKSYLQKEQGW